MKIRQIINCIEDFAPLSLQEAWDNSGLQVGDYDREVDSALITIDVTEEVVEDAINNGEKLIISHHPLIFSGLKRITEDSSVERIISKAIKNDIAIYSAHTNLDIVKNGVSWKMAEKVGLKEIRVLSPLSGALKKLITYVPENYSNIVRDAIFSAGAGCIGNYDNCSFNSTGFGTFRGNSDSKPFVGEAGELHVEREEKIEIIFPGYIQSKIVRSLLEAHPYEEVAYDIISLDNSQNIVGLGIIGELEEEKELDLFLEQLKTTFNCAAVRYSGERKSKIKKVAMCGGSGSSLLKGAIKSGADIFVTGDFKYHQFFENDDKIIIADIGHFESEQFTKELFYEIVTNKFSKFALRLSEIQTNPVKYLF